jgi:hypothetical protein
MTKIWQEEASGMSRPLVSSLRAYIKKPALVNRFRQEQHLVKYHSAQEDICCI